MRKFFVLPLAAALMLAAPAHAAPATEEGAAKIKQQVEKALEFPIQLAISAGPGLKLGGPVTVTPKGEYYEVQLPGASFDAGIGFQFNLGTVVANVKENDDGSLLAKISVPTTITAAYQDGKPVAEMQIGRQQFIGTWWPELAAFTQLKSEYGDITLKSIDSEEFTGKAGSLTAYINLTKNDDGTWSGPYGYGGKDISLRFSQNVTMNAAIDSFAADSSYEKMNLAARKAIQDKIGETLEKTPQNGELTPDQANAMLQSMMTNLSGYLEGMGSKVNMSGVTFNVKADPATVTPGEPIESLDVTMKSVNSTFDVNGMTQEKGDSKLQINLSGINVESDNAEIKSLLPNDVNLEVHLNDLPMKKLAESLSNSISSVMGMFGGLSGAPDASKQIEIQQQAMMHLVSLATLLPQQLSAAGSRLEIKNTYMKSADLDSTLAGELKANPTSPIVAEGSITLSLKGIDELILKLQSLAQKPDASPELARYASTLSMLQVYGQPAAAQDGKSIRKLTLNFSKEGQILLNGQPILGGVVPQ